MESQHRRAPISATNIAVTAISPPSQLSGGRDSPPSAVAMTAANTGSIVMTTAAVVADRVLCAHACTPNPRQVASSER